MSLIAVLFSLDTDHNKVIFLYISIGTHFLKRERERKNPPCRCITFRDLVYKRERENDEKKEEAETTREPCQGIYQFPKLVEDYVC